MLELVHHPVDLVIQQIIITVEPQSDIGIEHANESQRVCLVPPPHIAMIAGCLEK